MSDNLTYIRWFNELCVDDVPLVGGKNASLGEMYRELNPLGINVPNGFAVTADAYRSIIKSANIDTELIRILKDVDANDIDNLAKKARQAREMVYGADIPKQIRKEIISAYHELQKQYGNEVSLAVRSSATAEDLPSASFAGQHESYLNIRGEEKLLDACRRGFASLFTDRAIIYRINKGFDFRKVALSLGIMKMVRSDLESSGVMFTLDTESGFPDVVFITGAYGLGENIVQGMVDPDEFYVHKPTFDKGYRVVLRRVKGDKQVMMVYGGTRGGHTTSNIPTPRTKRERFCITDDEVLTLADYAIKLEKHYSNRAGRDMPMDIEWAKDGEDGKLYLLQARPETVISQRSGIKLEEYSLTGSGEVLTTGRAIGTMIASGKAHVIPDISGISEFKAGEILVADVTTPDWGPVLKTASAIITNRGGRTCHAAIVARELGIPAIVGTEDGTEKIKDGQTITVSCSEGEVGKVYAGEVAYNVESYDLKELKRPGTSIMLNLANPDVAFKTSMLPNDGVGLARMEFIINEYIKIHPMALVNADKVENQKERDQINRLCKDFENPADYFV